MNQFKTSGSSFNIKEEDKDDLYSNIEKETCSVCSVLRKKEVLCHPLYFYKTKFPFIFDKAPNVKVQTLDASKEQEIYNDSNNKEENYFYDSSSNELPSIEDILVSFMNNNPELDLTSDLKETEIQQRKLKMDEIEKIMKDNYEQIKSTFETSNKRHQKQKRTILMNLKANSDINKQIELIKKDSFVTKQITAGNSFFVQFVTCQHLVHQDCVIFKRPQECTCPICRLNRNGFLLNIEYLAYDSIFDKENNPNYEVTSENLSNELKESLNFFLRNYSNFVKTSNDKIVDVFVELVKSISGLIVTYEVRLRNLPNCLYSKKSKYLPRNLFLATWYSYRYMGKPNMKTGFENDFSEDVESKLTIFQRFIESLIECDELEGIIDEEKKNQKFQEITSSYIKTFDNEKELFLFLKRVCLVDYFLLNQNNINYENKDEEMKYVDWDEILTSENHSQRYKVTLNELKVFEFRPFIFSKLPKEFIRFAQDPYNFPVDQTSQVTLFNNLDYNNLILNYNDFNEDDDSSSYTEYLKELTILDHHQNFDLNLKRLFSSQNYPSILLFIGIHASKVKVIYKDKHQELKPFYLYKF